MAIMAVVLTILITLGVTFALATGAAYILCAISGATFCGGLVCAVWFAWVLADLTICALRKNGGDDGDDETD